MLNDTTLSKSTEEKDLGVLIDNELKFINHIKGIVAKANRMIGLIKISFENIDEDMFINLYNTLIRPSLNTVYKLGPHTRRKTLYVLKMFREEPQNW